MLDSCCSFAQGVGADECPTSAGRIPAGSAQSADPRDERAAHPKRDR